MPRQSAALKNLEKARAALAAKRNAAKNANPAPTMAVLLDADVASVLQTVAAVNGESPSMVVRRLLSIARKPGAKIGG